MRCAINNNIQKRISAGVELLKKHYALREIPIIDAFHYCNIGELQYLVEQFEIEGVGNLVTMRSANSDEMQMDTFVITPYYKNLPLFTTDYLYYKDKRMFLNEIYSLVEYKDDLYERFIQRFSENCKKVSHMPDMPMPPCWYDDIRPVYAGKVATPEQDDGFDLFINNLQTFIDMEKASPLLDPERLKAKWEQNFNYARDLVERGGVSTALFVKAIGADMTKTFFYSVFFAPDDYRV